MNTDKTARSGDEAEQGVTHYAGGTANAFARALAYEVGCGAVVHVTAYGATFVEWRDSDFRLAIEADANGMFHVMQSYGDEKISLTRAADVARDWLRAWSIPPVDESECIKHLEALEAAERQIHRLIHGEGIESDRICDHELRYANLRSAIIHAGLDPDEVERRHADMSCEGPS